MLGERDHDRMTWQAPQVVRADPKTINPERAALEDWLRFHRQTLLVKCAGLTAEQLKTAAVEPSNLSLLGLVRHMAEVERSWFRRGFAGLDAGYLYCSEDDRDGDFDNVADADAEADFATYRAECAAADEAATGHGLDETFRHRRTGTRFDLRWVYLHMIEEYARHNGHADLLRERIDGVVGD
jgi:uncharacterized damage-inducible protein DinB